MLKTGIVSSAYFQYNDYDVGLRQLKEDGYDCCDYHGFIHAVSPLYRYDEEELQSYLAEVYQSAEKYGVEFNQLHAQWPLKCSTEEETLRSIESAKKSIRGAAYLHCHNVVMHTFAPFGWQREVDAEATFDKNVEIFSTVADYAKDFDVTICIENLPFTELEISKVGTVLRLIEVLNRPNCKMCFDVGHAHVFHDDIAEDIIKIGSRLQVLHVHDNSGQHDSHIMPWQGTVNWNSFTKALKEVGFDGCISLETYVKNNMPHEIKVSMRKLLARLAQIIAKL